MESTKKRPFALLYSISYFLLGLLAPPRPTEEVVRELTLDTLLYLAQPDGTLPYHRPEVKALVWEIKYRNNARAAALAGAYLADIVLAEAAEELGTPLLIPIPMHPERRRERGHNQTEVLCEAVIDALSSRTPLEEESLLYKPAILQRIKHTSQQQGLARHKRLTNIKNSMRVSDPSTVKGRVCIIVDDVSTTGATLMEAARALRKAGAGEVKEVVLARS